MHNSVWIFKRWASGVTLITSIATTLFFVCQGKWWWWGGGGGGGIDQQIYVGIRFGTSLFQKYWFSGTMYPRDSLAVDWKILNLFVYHLSPTLHEIGLCHFWSSLSSQKSIINKSIIIIKLFAIIGNLIDWNKLKADKDWNSELWYLIFAHQIHYYLTYWWTESVKNYVMFSVVYPLAFHWGNTGKWKVFRN